MHYIDIWPPDGSILVASSDLPPIGKNIAVHVVDKIAEDFLPISGKRKLSNFTRPTQIKR